MARLSNLVRRRSFGFSGPEGEMFDEQNSLSSLSRPPITNESIAAQRMPQNYIQRSGGEVIDLGPSWQNTTVNGMPAAVSPNQQDMVIFAPNGQYQTTMAEQQAIAERRRQDAEIADLPRQMALAKLKEQQLKATAGDQWETKDTAGGLVQINKQTGDIRKLGIESAKSAKKPNLSSAAQKELFEATDTVEASKNVLGLLDEAEKLNEKAYSGWGATERAALRSNIPLIGDSESANATINLDNIMTSQALANLKAVFGGMPTEGERKILLDIQASPSKTPQQRRDIIKRAREAAKQRLQFNAEKARQLRSGEFFGDTSPTTEQMDIAWESNGAPVIGQVVDGFVYVGGNPADPASWKGQ